MAPAVTPLRNRHPLPPPLKQGIHSRQILQTLDPHLLYTFSLPRIFKTYSKNPIRNAFAFWECSNPLPRDPKWLLRGNLPLATLKTCLRLRKYMSLWRLSPGLCCKYRGNTLRGLSVTRCEVSQKHVTRPPAWISETRREYPPEMLC